MSEAAGGRRGCAVIGLGNPLLGDDGFGLVALARLAERWRVGDAVDLVDGGTWGMSLLPTIEDVRHVLFLDAIDVGRTPGTPVRLVGPDIPRVLSMKLSPHQIDLREVLAVAAMRGTLPAPDDLVAVGVQPAALVIANGEVVDGGKLTPSVAAQVDAVADAAAAQLALWGYAAARAAPAASLAAS